MIQRCIRTDCKGQLALGVLQLNVIRFTIQYFEVDGRRVRKI